LGYFWSEWQDLNLRPPRPERCVPSVIPYDEDAVGPVARHGIERRIEIVGLPNW
jgi:hypothetical protein